MLNLGDKYNGYYSAKGVNLSSLGDKILMVIIGVKISSYSAVLFFFLLELWHT